MSPEEVELRSAAIRKHLVASPEFTRAKGVLLCLSFGNEVCTWPLLEIEDKDWFVPRADFNNLSLHLHWYPCELETLPMGLRQPRAGQREIAEDEVGSTIQLAVIVGLAFDRHTGYRVGYGPGFFDRFLQGRTFAKAGLAYNWQLVDSVPGGPHDVPMDLLVTDEGVVRCYRRGVTEQ